MIYTTYFAKLKDLPGDVVPIAICAKTPQGYQGLQYKKLAPTYNILMTYKENHDAEQYDKDYKEQILTRLNADTVVKELSALAGGKDFALVCYEKSADFCHRQLVANWLRNHKYQCEEWKPLAKTNTPKIRVIVAGSREFDDYEFLKDMVDETLLSLGYKNSDIMVVCGEARGADRLGKRYAIENNIPVQSFIPDWNGLGRAAGYIRNAEMAKYATKDGCIGVLIAFWDGQSKGTKSMIDLAKSHNMQTYVFQYKERAMSM